MKIIYKWALFLVIQPIVLVLCVAVAGKIGSILAGSLDGLGAADVFMNAIGAGLASNLIITAIVNTVLAKKLFGSAGILRLVGVLLLGYGIQLLSISILTASL